MFDIVTKRDGRPCPFDKSKITIAITKAVLPEDSLTPADIDSITDDIVAELGHIASKETLRIETIQDTVERVLIKRDLHAIAKRYILYRYKRMMIRESGITIMEKMKELTFEDASVVDDKRENANINTDSPMGMMLKYGTNVAKQFYRHFMIDSKHVDAHLDGSIHIHDEDFLGIGTTTCTQLDLRKLFKNGFTTGQGYIREPSNINSYSALACIAIQSNQNDQHGGQSIPCFDHHMARGVSLTYIKELAKCLICRGYGEPAVKECQRMLKEYLKSNDGILDDKGCAYVKHVLTELLNLQSGNEMKFIHDITFANTEKATYQAMESFIHNLGSMASRAGSQVPFSSINFGTSTTVEGRMIIKQYLLALDAGLGNGETPIFPISIMKLKKGINHPGDINYDLFQLACKVSAKRLFPNFVNLDASFNLPYYDPKRPETEVVAMGCVDGEYTIDLKLNGVEYKGISFQFAFEFIQKALRIGYTIHDTTGEFLYLSSFDVDVYDSNTGDYVKCHTMIRNRDLGNWRRLTLQICGADEDCAIKTLYVTHDHPFPVKGKGRINTVDILPGDCIPRAYTFHKDQLNDFYEVISNEHTGFRGRDSFDVTTESDRFDFGGVQSHNCRTRVIGNIHDPERQTVFGRGNLSFTTINLVKLALESKKDLDVFFKEYDRVIQIVVDQLLDRLAIQSKKKIKNFPFLMGQGVWLDSEHLNPEDTIGDILKHGTLTIGFIGLAECLVALTGSHHGESEEARELGIRIVKHLRQRSDEAAQLHKLNFSVIATPAEGIAGRFVILDRAIHGTLEDITDRGYYTNSFHVPVYHQISASKKIQIEGPYHAFCNAGAITYIEVDGDPGQNVEAFEELVWAMIRADIGYCSINHPVDHDPVCGYTGIINECCPRCGRREGESIDESKYYALQKQYRDVISPLKELSHE